jgi:hypothetical protein
VEEFQLKQKYNTVFVNSVHEVTYVNYDLVIFGDVLEHMSDMAARTELVFATISNRAVCASLPIIHAPQGAVNGNPYETHVKHWGFQEMRDVLPWDETFEGHTIGAFWWEDSSKS